MKKSIKVSIDKLKEVHDFLKEDEFDENELANSNLQAKTIFTTFNKKISQTSLDGKVQSITFVYCLLQAKIAKICSQCKGFLVYEGLHNASKTRLTNYFLKQPKAIHCLECNFHDTQPHQCEWCFSMLCHNCCPNYWLQN